MSEEQSSLLFELSAAGRFQALKSYVLSFRGTGLACPRLALLQQRNPQGLTAAELARAQGWSKIADWLERERMRLEIFE